MKLFSRFRSGRRNACEELFSARALCIAGLLAMPALLFNPVTPLRFVQFLFFWFLCWLAGKKNNPFATVLVFTGIVAFNLIMPYGRVLYSIGTFNITLGALMTGIHRAATLEGLIMLSRLAIRPDLKIPGGFGALVGESFRFFAGIINLMNSKKRVTRKNLIEDIDRLMIDLSGDGALDAATAHPLSASSPQPDTEIQTPEYPEAVPAARTKASGVIILAIVVILAWFPLFLTHFLL